MRSTYAREAFPYRSHRKRAQERGRGKQFYRTLVLSLRIISSGGRYSDDALLAGYLADKALQLAQRIEYIVAKSKQITVQIRISFVRQDE